MNDDDRDALRRALAHDLRTPLAIIAGYAELLRVRDDEQTRAEAPVRIVEAVERLTRELNALLDRLGPSPGVAEPGALQRILVVDDDDDIRGLLRLTFPSHEFEVLEAADADQASALIRDGDPHLVILDWELPDRSGGDVLAELKSRAPHVPAVILTADASHWGSARRLGAERFLTKPFNPVELIRAIEELAAS